MLNEMLPWRSALPAIAALLVHAAAGPVPEALLLDRTVPLADRPWAPLTAHLVHIDGGHLFWDVLGLLLVGVVFEPLLKGRLWPVLFVGALAIAIGFGAAMPEFQRYCGLSGLINVIAGAGLVAALRERDATAIAFGLLVVAKVAAETLLGSALLTQTAWPPAHAAHAIGLLAGALPLLIVEAFSAIMGKTQQSSQGVDPCPPSPTATNRSAWSMPSLSVRWPRPAATPSAAGNSKR